MTMRQQIILADIDKNGNNFYDRRPPLGHDYWFHGDLYMSEPYGAVYVLSSTSERKNRTTMELKSGGYLW
jgi:hypothetical protein